MAVRLIMLIAALVVIAGLGAGVQAAQFTTAKNFVPAPNTPSYFVDEDAPFRANDHGSSASPRRDAVHAPTARRAAESSLAPHRQLAKPAHASLAAQAASRTERNAGRHRNTEAHKEPEQLANLRKRMEVSKEAERDLLRQRAEARHKPAERADQIPAISKQTGPDTAVRTTIAGGEASGRPIAPPRSTKPFAANERNPGITAQPQPATLPTRPPVYLSAPETRPRLAAFDNVASAHHAGLSDGLVRIVSLLSFAAVAITLSALSFFWRRKHIDADTAVLEVDPYAADLNALLTKLEAKIRRKLPRGTPFRLSLLPDLWPCHADEVAIATTLIDLSGATAADLGPENSIIVGTRHIRVDVDLAAESPHAIPGDYVRLTLRENGRGLSETAYDQIFDPVATIRPAIVRASELMRRLGGFVRVETAEDVGTAVHLYFRPIIAAASG